MYNVYWASHVRRFVVWTKFIFVSQVTSVQIRILQSYKDDWMHLFFVSFQCQIGSSVAMYGMKSKKREGVSPVGSDAASESTTSWHPQRGQGRGES